VGAGIDTAASIAQNTPDLLGLPRDAAAARILGALTRVKATCSSGPVGKL
jgi:hypothetical protein